jgi:hypothetical protein
MDQEQPTCAVHTSGSISAHGVASPRHPQSSSPVQPELVGHGVEPSHQAVDGLRRHIGIWGNSEGAVHPLLDRMQAVLDRVELVDLGLPGRGLDTGPGGRTDQGDDADNDGGRDSGRFHGGSLLVDERPVL